MANNYQAVYYRRADGTQPVESYIDDCIPAKQQPAILRQVDRLNTLDDAMPHLPFPHSSQIEGELRELRCHYGRTHYRVLYRRSQRLIVLLHMLLKTTDAVPQADIDAAKSAWEDYKQRMDASPRVPPRAAGRDAP